MNTMLMNNINWVGYVDWNVRDFHGYSTDRGATYNAYLVQDEKTALIDSVKAPYVDNLLKNIRSHTDLDKVDYIVVNHAEPDHGGGLSKTVEALPNAVVVCDQKCKDIISGHHDTTGWNFHIVKTGDELSLGKRTLQFIETPMVHWPDSMFTYIPEEKLLFSMDAFGQHYATSARFDDEVSLSTTLEEAKKYYANIVMPFGKMVSKVLDAASGLDIDMIAPSHGVIWRTHLPEILSRYAEWAECKARPKVVIMYDTMWQATEKIAMAMTEGASIEGVETILLNVRASSLTVVATEVLDAAVVAIGTSNLNQNMLPMMAAVLTYLKGLKPVGKSGMAFGSYGWGKGGCEQVDQWINDMKWDTVHEMFKCKFTPDAAVLSEAEKIGKILAEKAGEIAQ